MRNLRDVINAVLEVVPTKETGAHFNLMRVWQDIGTTAPELMILRWEQAQNFMDWYVFSKPIGEEYKPWQLKALDIWTNTQNDN